MHATHSPRLRAELALALCTLLWGSTFVVVKNSLDHSSVFVFLALRFTLAGICMAAFRPRVFRVLQREEIFVTSAALCNPRSASGANRRPAGTEIRNCSDFLRRTIALVNPSVIVTLGTVALEALKLIHYHEFTLRNDAAQIRPWHERTLIPLYHPSPQVLITSRKEAAQLRDYQVIAHAIRANRGNK